MWSSTNCLSHLFSSGCVCVRVRVCVCVCGLVVPFDRCRLPISTGYRTCTSVWTTAVRARRRCFFRTRSTFSYVCFPFRDFCSASRGVRVSVLGCVYVCGWVGVYVCSAWCIVFVYVCFRNFKKALILLYNQIYCSNKSSLCFYPRLTAS